MRLGYVMPEASIYLMGILVSSPQNVLCKICDTLERQGDAEAKSTRVIFLVEPPCRPQQYFLCFKPVFPQHTVGNSRHYFSFLLLLLLQRPKTKTMRFFAIHLHLFLSLWIFSSAHLANANRHFWSNRTANNDDFSGDASAGKIIGCLIAALFLSFLAFSSYGCFRQSPSHDGSDGQDGDDDRTVKSLVDISEHEDTSIMEEDSVIRLRKISM